MKKLLTCVGLVISLFFSASAAQASDLTITCSNEGPCSVSPASTPLFGEANWQPGSSTTYTLSVTNNDTNDSCTVYLDTTNETQSPSTFASQIFTAIRDNVTTFFGQVDGLGKATSTSSLQDVYDAGSFSLGSISSGATKDYLWTATMNQDAGNDYQAGLTHFDISASMVCGTAPPPSATPSPGGGTVSGASTTSETCDDAKPSSAPVLSISAIGLNSVVLSWTLAGDPVSYYLVAYGLTSSADQYGNPNVGGQGTTTYTVEGLSGNTTYYFKVRAGNGCTPGDFSNIVFTTTGPGGVVQGAATDFVEGVLGVSTETEKQGEIGESSTQVIGDVAGATSCSDKYYPWWLPLVFQGIISLLYYWIIWANRRELITLLFPFALVVLSQIVHEVLGCNCATGKFCPWYWVFNLLVFVIPALYYFYKKRNSSKRLSSDIKG